MVNDYINYFRDLAIRHKDIQHDPLSESGEAGTGGKHFTRFSVEEVLKGMRNTVGYPCLCLELYDTDTEADILSNVRTWTRGAFMLIDHPASDSFADEQAVYAKMERIVYDILRQVYQDVYKAGGNRCLQPFKQFDFNKISIVPVGPVFSGQFGYHVDFNFRLQNQTNITLAPVPGTFITTPVPEIFFTWELEDSEDFWELEANSDTWEMEPVL